jgi:hypothetical protein
MRLYGPTVASYDEDDDNEDVLTDPASVSQPLSQRPADQWDTPAREQTRWMSKALRCLMPARGKPRTNCFLALPILQPSDNSKAGILPDQRGPSSEDGKQYNCESYCGIGSLYYDWAATTLPVFHSAGRPRPYRYCNDAILVRRGNVFWFHSSLNITHIC